MRKAKYDNHFSLSSEEFAQPKNTSAAFGDDDAEMGNIFEDIGDAGKSILGTIGDAVPDFIKKAVSDFADSSVGHVVLFVVSANAYYALAPALGPQLAAAIYAMPGMVRGDGFMKAWTEGFMERITMLIKYFISTGVPADKATDMVNNLSDDSLQKMQTFVNKLPPDAVKGMDYKMLAAQAGVREDMAAQYLANANGNLALPKEYKFDPATGKTLGPANLNPREKAKLIAASQAAAVNLAGARSGLQKGRVIGNIAVLNAAAQKTQTSHTAEKVIVSTGAAGLGAAAAVALGASLPITLGVAGVLGVLGWLAKGSR